MENRYVFLTWVPVVFCLVQIPEIRLLETVVDLFVVPGLFTGNYRPSFILNKIKIPDYVKEVNQIKKVCVQQP